MEGAETKERKISQNGLGFMHVRVGMSRFARCTRNSREKGCILISEGSQLGNSGERRNSSGEREWVVGVTEKTNEVRTKDVVANERRCLFIWCDLSD